MPDTIVAQATPAGESALSLVRISGDLSIQIMEQACGVYSPTPRHAYYKKYTSDKGNTLDQVIVTFYEENKSFTSEKSLELTCHGNQLIVEKIIDDLILKGCRIATPGEFTLRSFLSGKIDLTQAEAIAELIGAKNEDALQLANKNLAGGLSKEIIKIQDECIKQHARLEAFIDFPEDDIGDNQHESVCEEFCNIQKRISGLIDISEKTNAFNKEINVVLIGPPNAGKSSIFNCIIGTERSIVNEIEGTTRDYIDYDLKLKKNRIKLFDTAGIRNTKEEIEQTGITKTLDLMRTSDLLLLVLDSAAPYPSDIEYQIKNIIKKDKTLIVLNKSDLDTTLQLEESYLEDFRTINTSIQNPHTIENLIDFIDLHLDQKFNQCKEHNFYVNVRHTVALQNAFQNLEFVISNLKDNSEIELSVPHIKATIEELGLIVGKKDNEKMLDALFSSFCIGK